MSAAYGRPHGAAPTTISAAFTYGDLTAGASSRPTGVRAYFASFRWMNLTISTMGMTGTPLMKAATSRMMIMGSVSCNRVSMGFFLSIFVESHHNRLS